MLQECKDIVQLHDDLRKVIKKSEIGNWIATGQIQSHLFLSMCSTINNDIHRDALFDLCSKFKFVRPFARKILKGFMTQYNDVKAGASIPACPLTDRTWNNETKHAILILREKNYSPTDPILKCVQDMIKYDLHMNAMFEVCEKYGAPARTVVTFVLNRYTQKVDMNSDNIDDLNLDSEALDCV